jgi:hypothetical protein
MLLEQQSVPIRAISASVVIATALLAGPAFAQGSGQDGVKRLPPAGMPRGNQKVFPYELVNYTQPAHNIRIMNSPVIVLGRVESYEVIEGTDKIREKAVYLRVESWLRTDRPGLENAERIYFRTMPLSPPYEDFQVGERCLMLLERDLRIDNALILGTDFYCYKISDEGVVQKFIKHRPTTDDPVIVEQSLSSFLEDIRGLLRQVSLEEQTYNSDLVMIGTVTDSRQGEERAEDFIYVKVEPDKVFKGDPGKGELTLIQKANAARWAIQALNRNAFKQGDRVLCFANKDPTYSKPGTWNPKGDDLWIFPFQRISSLFISDTTAWRRGFRPIMLERLYADLEKWSEKAAQSN